VADQTSVLALNAAIRAAAAGEHGKGFAVVAEEVRRLAERTTTASAQIDALVKGIQAETSEAITAMAEGTQEVVAGAQVADEAGRALARIDATSVQLAELIEAISLAAEQQARASSGIARAMGEISGITTGTTAGTQQAAASVAALATLADDLRASVAAFRLGNDGATPSPAAFAAPPARPDYDQYPANGHSLLTPEFNRGGQRERGLIPGAPGTAVAPERRAAPAVATVEKPSLYELLGGQEGVAVIVDDFYQRVLADASLAPLFAGVDLAHLRRHQEHFLGQAFGGPVQYSGRRLEQAHKGLQIAPAQFDAFTGHLRAALEALAVPQPVVAEAIDHVTRQQGAVVEK
jgi:truncated hemoglobin YjbI